MLNDAIEHCQSVVERLEPDCDCYVEHKNLLSLLEELKSLRVENAECKEIIRSQFKRLCSCSTDYAKLYGEYQYLVFKGILGNDCPLYPNNDYFNSVSCPGCPNYPEYAFCSSNFECIKNWTIRGAEIG